MIGTKTHSTTASWCRILLLFVVVSSIVLNIINFYGTRSTMTGCGKMMSGFSNVRDDYEHKQMYSREFLNFDYVRCRDDLVLTLNKLNLLGNAAEIGVYQGDFALKNLQRWKGRMYYMIDAWQHRDNDPLSAVNARGNDHNEKNETQLTVMERARQKTGAFEIRRKLIRAMSLEAAAMFPDHFFDFVYVDALHVYESVYVDLRAWWPKVKPGGMLAGDDYVDASDERVQNSLVAHNRIPADYNWGVPSAVRNFSAFVGVPHFVTYVYDCYPFPAWYMMKPL